MELARAEFLCKQTWDPYKPEEVYVILVNSLRVLNEQSGDYFNVFFAALDLLHWALSEVHCPLPKLSSLCAAVFSLTAKQVGASEEQYILYDFAQFAWANFRRFGLVVVKPTAEETLRVELLLFQMLGGMVPKGDAGIVRAFLTKTTWKYAVTFDKQARVAQCVEYIIQKASTPAFFAMSHKLFIETVEFSAFVLLRPNVTKIYADVLYVANLEYKRRGKGNKRRRDEPKEHDEVRRGPEVDPKRQKNHETVLH